MGASVTPVILCGGVGARLWPLSTRARPKPFHAIDGDETLLQATARRLAPGPDASFSAPIVICSAAHRDLVRSQLDAIGVRPALVIVEREGRGTAFAAALAVRATREAAPGSLVLLAPADHQVADPAAFRASVAQAATAARRRVVLFAAPPDCAETGYGYIRMGRPLAGGLRRVQAFVEKPDRTRAQAMLAQGAWAWNAGLFLASPDVLANEIARHAPEIDADAGAAWTRARRAADEVLLGPIDGVQSPRSLDAAVIEHSGRLAAAACDMRWADVGCWRSLSRLVRDDGARNRVRGPAKLVDSTGCMVWSSGKPVAVIGMTDVVVVTTPDGVLVMPRERAQEVGRLGMGD